MISTELFRNFLTVYREGSVSSAARSRHLTQSAVSQQLSSLEEVIGAPLFQRTVRGMIPTARGKSLYDQVFESIDKLDRVSRVILKNADSKTLDRSPAPIRVGTSPDYFDVFALPRLKANDFACIVTFGEPRELHALLQSGMLDAVISVAKPTVRALQYRILGEKRYVLIGASGVKPKKPFRNLNDLANWLKHQHWVGYSVELPNTRRFWQQAFGLRLEAQLRIRCTRPANGRSCRRTWIRRQYCPRLHRQPGHRSETSGRDMANPRVDPIRSMDHRLSRAGYRSPQHRPARQSTH
jgi:DNA-binding transcriptional LysR family regulator